MNTVILIDEYDVPLENAYFRGFYVEMVDFIRSLFESALKIGCYGVSFYRKDCEVRLGKGEG